MNPEKVGAGQTLWVFGSEDDLAGSALAALLDGPLERLRQGSASIRGFGNLYAFQIPAGKGAETRECRIRFFVGKRWVVTLFAGEVDAFEEFRERDEEEDSQFGQLTGTGLMADLLMSHIEALRRELTSVEHGVDELDENILRSRHKHDPLLSMTVLRRRVARLRRVVSAIRPIVATLTRPGFSPVMEEGDQDSLGALGSALERLSDEVIRTRETVIGSYDLYTTKISQDTNAILQVLTVVTVITGCIGALAGVFGMNFQTPFFNEGARAFHLVVTLMCLFAVASSIAIFILMRRKG